MGFVAWTIELLVGSPAERDITRSPLNLSPKEAVAERPGRANATCWACGYKRTTAAHDKVPLLAFGLPYITRVACFCRHELTSTLHTSFIAFLAYHTLRFLFALLRCTKCLNLGHTPLTIALSPLLFQREITQNGVIFKYETRRSCLASFVFAAGRARRCLSRSGGRPWKTTRGRTTPARLTRRAGSLLWPTSLDDQFRFGGCGHPFCCRLRRSGVFANQR